MKRYALTLLSVAALSIAALSAAGQAGAGGQHQVSVQEGVPTVVSYQGYVTVDGNAYTGTGYFKFAIRGINGQVTWSNDGTLSDLEPTASVPLSVTSGLFNVLLGDTSLQGMSSQLNDTAFANSETSLRVWFSSDGATFQMLSPDRRIASVPYAMQANIARQADKIGGYDSSMLSTLGHTHAGTDITSTVPSTYIAADIARLSQITTTMLANDGSGSGLDADLLDGQHAAAFVTTAGAQTITGAKTFSPAGGSPFTVTSSTQVTNLNADQVDGMHALGLHAIVTATAYAQWVPLGTACGPYAVATPDSTVISLTVPGPGIIVVQANTRVTLSSGRNVTLALSETSGDCGDDGDAHVTHWFTGSPRYENCGLFSCNPTHYSMSLTLNVRRSFDVREAGTHAFFLNGWAEPSTMGSHAWESADVIVQYYP